MQKQDALITPKSKIVQDRAKELGIPCVDIEIHQRDAHIQFTHQIARHEYLHALAAKDYATAMYWSLIWFETLGLFNIAADYCVNPWKGG